MYSVGRRCGEGQGVVQGSGVVYSCGVQEVGLGGVV